MKTAAVIIATIAQVSLVRKTVRSVHQNAPKTEVYLCFIDAETPQEIQVEGCKSLSGKELIGKDFLDEAFFLTFPELVIRCSMHFTRALLGAEQNVLWLAPGACLTAEPVEPGENMCIFAREPHRLLKTIPLAALPQQISYSQDYILFSSGAQLVQFVCWACDKMSLIITKGWEKRIEGSEFTLDSQQRDFFVNWSDYLARLGCGQQVRDAAELLFEPADECEESPQCKFETFSDGTPIVPIVRDYYGVNYRLRRACKGNPFACRTQFTDISVVPGDKHVVPITAAAQAIYERRLDLRIVFPSNEGARREAFLDWFLNYGMHEYQLPAIYGEAVENKLRAWRANNAAKAALNRRFSERVAGRLRRLCGGKPKKMGEAPALLHGVNLCGFIEGDFGIGEATRILADCLDAGHIPFTIVESRAADEHAYGNDAWAHKITNEFIYDINLWMTNADGLPFVLKDFSPSVLENRYNIGFWYWELPLFPQEWVGSFAYVDEVWAASDFTRDAIAAKTDKPVITMPCSIKQTVDETLTRADFGMPKEPFIFLMMYDARSFQARKNPQAVVAAFLKAFKGDMRVRLFIKVNAPNGWNGEDELLEDLKQYANIISVAGTYTKPQLNALLCCCDAFVSLHRSEGFGLGPAEAMYWGKPVILTNWSGNTVYMREDNCCAVDYTIVEIDKDYGPYKKGNHWAESDVNDAARKMRRLVDDADYYQKIAQNGKKTIREEFSPEAISKLFINRLAKIWEMREEK